MSQVGMKPQKNRTHIEALLFYVREIYTWVTATSGRPHGLEIMKKAEYVAPVDTACRKKVVLEFMDVIGTRENVQSIMGDRWNDILNALEEQQGFPSNPPQSTTDILTASAVQNS
ncbi:hypothetical protein M422DRAFT_239408 [Sphaerobolus stellatus SS14]|nr:hypothetical protein M422DRAFT_239408 [Sphaerobolus stellatus SS14]